MKSTISTDDFLLNITNTKARAKADSAAAIEIIKTPKTCPDKAVLRANEETSKLLFISNADGVKRENDTAAIMIPLNINSIDIIVETIFVFDKIPYNPIQKTAADNISKETNVIVFFSV